MRARVPASSANLGPGFDTLALALALHVEVEVVPAPRFALRAEGEGAELAAGDQHLAARVVSRVRGERAMAEDPVEIVVRSSIPVGRGLGSSAALAAAAAAAAGSTEPLAVAAEVDGHPENAAASVLGGLVTATVVDGRAVVRRLPLDPRLAFVVVVPERQLLTKAARSVLPSTVAFADAVANLGRMGLLVAGLANGDDLDPVAGDDRLHQEARSQLFPEAPELLARLRSAGALVACWSGAGPSLLAVCRSSEQAEAVREAGDQALAASGVPGSALVLPADRSGLVVEV